MNDVSSELAGWLTFSFWTSLVHRFNFEQLLHPGWLEIKWLMLCWMLSNCHRLLLCWWCKCVPSTSLSFLPTPCIASQTYYCRTSSLCLPSTPSQSSDHFKGKSISLYPDYHLASVCNWTVLPSQWDCIGKQYPAEWSNSGSWIARGSTKTVWVL